MPKPFISFLVLVSFLFPCTRIICWVIKLFFLLIKIIYVNGAIFSILLLVNFVYLFTNLWMESVSGLIWICSREFGQPVLDSFRCFLQRIWWTFGVPRVCTQANTHTLTLTLTLTLTHTHTHTHRGRERYDFVWGSDRMLSLMMEVGMAKVNLYVFLSGNCLPSSDSCWLCRMFNLVADYVYNVGQVRLKSKFLGLVRLKSMCTMWK